MRALEQRVGKLRNLLGRPGLSIGADAEQRRQDLGDLLDRPATRLAQVGAAVRTHARGQRVDADVSAGGVEVLTGDLAGVWSGQVDDQRGYVIWIQTLRDRHATERADRRVVTGEELGGGAGQHAIDGDALA